MDALWWCRDMMWGKLTHSLGVGKRRVNICSVTGGADTSVPGLFQSLLTIPYKMDIIPILQVKKLRAKKFK